MTTAAEQGGDHERMKAVAGGDLSSMGEIYQNRHRPLFRFFYRMTSRQALSEDLVHEVFLRMIRYRHTYQKEGSEGEGANRDEGAFEAWMYRIARNTLVDHARKHRHETPSGEGELEEIVSARPNPFETAAKRQDLALLYKALRDLPEDKREVLILARFHGLNYEQIGEMLGCASGTVKGRVFRAMKELGSIYSDLCKEKAS
jgi:RNA polymerase sigma factor (sigma-70 family)